MDDPTSSAKNVYLESIQALLAETGALEGSTPEPTPPTDESISQESIAAAITELDALPVSASNSQYGKKVFKSWQ